MGVANAYRVRIELPDRPGALAQLTAAIAAHGGNVVAVDIHELDAETAVDEILLETVDPWDAGRLAAGLEASGARLISWAPAVGWKDPVVRSLRWAAAIASATPQESELELGRAVGEVANATAAWVCDAEAAMAYEVGREAMERGQAVVGRTDYLPSGVDLGEPGEMCILAVPDGDLLARVVAFAVRPVGQQFTASEIARIEALLLLYRTLVLPAPAAG
jgi:hypothetical protein